MTTKVKMGQELKTLAGEPIRLGGNFGMDQRTISLMLSQVLAKAELDAEAQARVEKRLTELVGRPLTLTEAVCTALTAPHDDDKALAGSERVKRLQLAMRLNRTGMAKVSEADVKFIMPLVERFYRGSLLSPQVESLLQGVAFAAGTTDEDEPEEPAS